MLGIPEKRVVIGLVARWHPMKDHGNLLKATAILRKQGYYPHLVMIGSAVECNNPELVQRIRDLELGDITSLLGVRHDLEQLTPGFDIACLCSAWGEAFPNVLGEAMACGVPCVTTDVGDATWLVGQGGIAVPSGNPEALARALGSLIQLGQEARREDG